MKIGEPFAEILGGTPRDAFNTVYGGVDLEFCAYNCADGWAWAYDQHGIKFDGMYSDRDIAGGFTTHELGHLFDRAVCAANGCAWAGAVSARSDLAGKTGTCGDSADCLGRIGYDNTDLDYWGFAGGKGNWQFALSSQAHYTGEIFADMFVGWVNNTWGDSTRCTNRQTYMNEQMSHYLTTNFSQP